MNKSEEIAYEQGKKRVYSNLLSECILHLRIKDNELSWLVERQEAINSLRDLCSKFGDNDWSDSLHLGDIIEKHLADYLWRK